MCLYCDGPLGEGECSVTGLRIVYPWSEVLAYSRSRGKYISEEHLNILHYYQSMALCDVCSPALLWKAACVIREE